MRIRIVTFGLDLPTEPHTAHALGIAPAFTAWPGPLARWWLGEGTCERHGTVDLFASGQDAGGSRDTALFRRMHSGLAFSDVTVRKTDLLGAPTAITAPAPPPTLVLQRPRRAPQPW